mmetsp:Transcript_14237/g.19024  ORF Transcript_14237/g.19024 Transcript_14237/m.19024 type:complete len:826 (+) Transcript_14237:153-2630(+)
MHSNSPQHMENDTEKTNNVRKSDSQSLAHHLLLKDGLWSCSSSTPLLSSVLDCCLKDTTANASSSLLPPLGREHEYVTTNQFLSCNFSLKDTNTWHLAGEMTEVNQDEMMIRTILTRMAFPGKEEERHDSLGKEYMEQGWNKQQIGVDFLVKELIVMIVEKFRHRQHQSPRRNSMNYASTNDQDDSNRENGAGESSEKNTTSTLNYDMSEKYTALQLSGDEAMAVPTSWTAVLKLLRILREVLLLSSEARECMRIWLLLSYSSCQSSNSREHVWDNSSPFSLMSTSRRVRGLDIDTLKTQTSMHLPCLRGVNFPASSKRNRTSWESQNRRQTCKSFINVLTTLSLGHHIASTRGTESCVGDDRIVEGQRSFSSIMLSPLHIIEMMAQREAILFILSHTCDAPGDSDIATKQSGRQHLIWSMWYDFLCGSVSGSIGCDDIASSSKESARKNSEAGLDRLRCDFISILERDVDGHKRRRLYHGWSSVADGDVVLPTDGDIVTRKRGRGQQRSKKRGRTSSIAPRKKSDCQERHTSNPNNDLCNMKVALKAEIKSLVLRVIIQLISSSASVRRRFFQVAEAGNLHPDNRESSKPMKSTCLGRRALAIVLDELEGRTLPSLRITFPVTKSQIPIIGDNGSEVSNFSPDCDILMSLSIMRFMACLCRCSEGVELLRTQMRIADDSDGHSQWSPSAIAVAGRVLDCSVAALYRNCQDIVPRYLESQNLRFMSALWSTNLKETVSFFRALRCHVQTQRHNSERHPKGGQVVPFLSMISEQRDVIYSCLHIIFYSGSAGPHGDEVDNNTINSVRMLLEELSFDEEEEEEMKHG